MLIVAVSKLAKAKTILSGKGVIISREVSIFTKIILK